MWLFPKDSICLPDDEDEVGMAKGLSSRKKPIVYMKDHGWGT